ncbi:hypothetical protein F0562_032378 [Nyssa sinensis]|uniref:Myb-like domain-containing protein n=1 Tax=Nyssa sinensis TaxID=561372 RepID=A0A5J5ASJ9_9ASTE|nr:hypothetical protein F0562_032378 [Nyssa sinensis]
MSESPSTSAKQVVAVDPHPQSRQPNHLPVIQGGATTCTITTTTTTATNISSSLVREYRKGNWTIQETVVLITAKKLDEERRIKASSTPPDPMTKQPPYSRTGELRWKWVENYCWSNGCLRSQNQCNDKWDNLLRDYKKVREYELRSQQSDGSGELPSYWAMDKQERKDRNLPSNMVSEVYEALKYVVQKRYPQTQRTTTTTATQQPIPAPPITVHAPPPPSPAVAPPAISETSDSSETEWSEKFDTDTKRRKVGDVGPSILRSATILAKTLRSREESKEKRHREIMELEERRLRLEETRIEVNSQGIAGLVAAVNNLSGAIQSLISDRHDQT